MITVAIALAVLVLAAVAFFVTRPVHPTLAASVADVPAIVAKLATCKDDSFAVFMFDSTFSPKGDAVNLHYSVKNGAVGLIGFCSARQTLLIKKRYLRSPLNWATP